MMECYKMKTKGRFFEPMIVYVVGFPVLIIGGLLSGILTIWLAVYQLCAGGERTVTYFVAIAIGILLVFVDVPYIWRTTIRDRVDVLYVTDQFVIWNGLLSRKRQLRFDQCTFIGIETFNKEGHRAIIRGDENAMIYFTTEPYPEEFRGRINHVHCSDTFIKFRYTDELARTLLEVLPEEKKPAIQAFYNQMQNRDYERQKAIRARKNNRARRKREKERRKQKKG